jgi:putative ATP-dependent endonuclease of OLD family
MRLAGLAIKNYRRIGAIESRIKIDEIVILVGKNNAGKSTVLDAYEAFASAGKELDISHFHKEASDTPVEITGVFDKLSEGDLDTIGKKWEHEDPECGKCIKVKWIWSKPGQKGQKQSFDPEKSEFVDGGVGGWDSLIQSRIPQPIRIRPTDPPEVTQTKIVGMLKEHIKSSLKNDASSTRAAFDQIELLAQKLFQESKSALELVSERITNSIASIFPGTTIEVVPRSKDALDEKLIAAESFLRVGTADGCSTPLSLQGTGIQRALLWSALSVMSETTKKKGKGATDVGRILLIDEPEAFLHPPTIRGARDSLYEFALNNPDWQVIATTHSPIFIDLSKDHTTIVRVDASSVAQHIVSTDDVSFGVDERMRLQMIRACNPIVNEFFFYEKIVLVEGPTEHIVIKHVAKAIGFDMHVIDCMGKANIPLFARILNHFKVPYVAIHDSDTPFCKRKGVVVKNGMWKLNENIRAAVLEARVGSIFTQFPHFEGAFLGEELKNGKVDNILEILKEETTEEYNLIFKTYCDIIKGEVAQLNTTQEQFEEKMSEYLTLKSLSTDWRWSKEEELSVIV